MFSRSSLLKSPISTNVFIILLSVLVTSKSNSFSTITKLDYLLKHVLKATAAGPESDRVAEEPTAATGNPPVPQYEANFIALYEKGVAAYLENDWEACINYMERSIQMQHRYTDALANCRIHCEFDREWFKNTRPENYDHIHFYEKLIVKTLCLEKCRQKNLSDLPKYFSIDREYRKVFRLKKPYEYLQMCYYREGEIEKAISATYTVLVANPGDHIMKKNIEYYVQQREFDWDKMKDLEAKRYSSYYLDGVDKYELKQWLESIELLEITLDLWLQEHDKCRALCEGDFEQGWLPDFTSSVSNHYVFTLRCKQNCTKEVSFVNGRFVEDLFPSIYNYLQFAYYNTNQTEKASRCAASYLLLYPEDEEMKHNIEFYESQPKESKKFLKPRPETEKFHGRAIYEAELLRFVDEEFSKLSKEPFRPDPPTDHFTDREIDYFDRNENLIRPDDIK